MKKRQKQSGLAQVDEENPFDLFVNSTNIRYTYYKESHKILGQTFGMCVLQVLRRFAYSQDFEALTPNLLARTIETVEGGGLVVLLLNTMTSLKQLYTMAMDAHSRFRTESHQEVSFHSL
jgi:N-acetyltransferase 10